MASSILKNKFLRLVKPSILSANYHLNRYKKVVWVIGSGRSGTTWVTDMLNYKRGFREVIEPFRPHVVESSNFLSLNEYVRPETDHAQLDAFYENVFSGKFRHVDADSAANQLRFTGLLVKDVFANLFAKHVHEKISDVKIILLIRNPFEVALSMHRKNNWVWMTNPLLFLNQNDLVEDFLQEHVSLIKDVGENGGLLERLILVWCIVNYVPLKQFKKGDLLVAFYEEVKENPTKSVSQMWSYIEDRSDDDNTIQIPEKIAKKISSVSQDLNKINKEKSSDWRSHFTKEQLEKCQHILQNFGFGELYDSSGVPDRACLAKFFS